MSHKQTRVFNPAVQRPVDYNPKQVQAVQAVLDKHSYVTVQPKRPFERTGTVSPDIDTLWNYQALQRTFYKVLPNFVGCSLVGGAVRDAMVGKTPKDLDILVCTSGEGCEYARAFRSLEVLAAEFSEAGWSTELCQAYGQGEEGENTHFQECYAGLLKITYPPAALSVDILVVREHLSLSDVVRTFDSNLTRVYMQPNGDCYGIAGEHPSDGLVIAASCRGNRIDKHVDFWKEHYHDPLH